MYGQQSGDQFQSHHDQLLTYSYSANVQSQTSTPSQKPKKKIQQKLTLNIVQPLKTIKQNQGDTSNNKFKKRSMYSNDGKIIKIGDAIFKSNFQCGSLGQVQQIKGQNTYLIHMQKQVNSNRPSAWFYFRCEGLKGQVNFIISGFTKTSSLYSQGMKICYRQIKKQQTHQNHHLNNLYNKHKYDWHRGGYRISYVGNYNTQTQQNIYQLKFTFNFLKNYDTHQYPTIQFAYCYPYQFKRINLLAKNLAKKGDVMFQYLGKTYEGRDIPLLTIGNPNASKSIVLSARVHPGQTVSSFIMEGLIKQLVSDNEFSRSLKQKYLFKIVPMINPDGVVRGNYRFSAAGYDLNRRWKHCYESSHPQIFHLKNMIKKLHKQKKVLMYIDIHGHSRKKSAFFYGCCAGKDGYLGQSYGSEQENSMSKPKEFPFLMSKLNQNFKYQYCTFNMSKDKQGTARIQMYKELHIDHVYTLESSFCGSAQGGQNYTEQDLMNMGKSLLEGISVYFYEKQSSPRQTTMCESLQITGHPKPKQQKNSLFQSFMNILNEAKQELKNSPQLLNVGMRDDSGSDSQPQAGIIPQQQRQVKSTTLGLDIPGGKDKQRQKSQQAFKSKSPAYLNNSKSIKITVRQQGRKKTRLTPEELKNIVDQKLEDLKNREEQKNYFQKQIIAMTVNNFYSHNSQQLDSLTSDALMKKNERVHSKQINTRSMLQKLKSQRLNSENLISNCIDFDKDEGQNDQQDQKRRLQIMTRNLLKTRQGVQYRRVKKLAEEMKKKHHNNFTNPSYEQPPIPMVRGIVTVNNELNLEKKRIKSIAPSFYPHSSQKNRRFSVQMAFRSNNNNSFRSGKIPFELANKKLFINGDDINVHCKGTKIYL